MLHSIYKKNAVNCVFETAFNSGWSLLPQQVTYVDLQVFPNSGKGGGEGEGGAGLESEILLGGGGGGGPGGGNGGGGGGGGGLPGEGNLRRSDFNDSNLFQS